MTNLEYLKKMKEFNKETVNVNAQCRTAKALEIIAEELIDTNRLIRTYIVDDGIKIEEK